MSIEPTAIGIRLRQARERRGLTQGALAERCSLHQAAFSRLESGQRLLGFAEAAALADLLHVPLEWFLTGEVRPGTGLPEIAAELRHLGLVDLQVSSSRVPGAYRPPEEVLALAIGAERPDLRVIEGLPAVLAWNRWRVGVLLAFAQATNPKALQRLGWLAEITLLLARTGGFPGGLASGDDLTLLLTRLERPHEPDDLGQPGGASPPHRAWIYWRIAYAIDLAEFRARAESLASLAARRPDA